MVTEHHKLWVKVYRDEAGTLWSEKTLSEINDSSQMPKVALNYEDSGSTCPSAYVEYVRFTDPSEGVVAASIEVLGTIEGPLMAIVGPPKDPAYITLVDPCIIIYDGKSRINLQPIFNTARVLQLKREAVRSVGAPSEILLALYPAFIIQNRMAAYQLKPAMPTVVSPPLTNDAEMLKS